MTASEEQPKHWQLEDDKYVYLVPRALPNTCHRRDCGDTASLQRRWRLRSSQTIRYTTSVLRDFGRNSVSDTTYLLE